jgi:hypothetical protein
VEESHIIQPTFLPPMDFLDGYQSTSENQENIQDRNRIHLLNKQTKQSKWYQSSRKDSLKRNKRIINFLFSREHRNSK